ncbi:MAG: WD40 repeat domain-containing protein [Anaerolineaceae bacterium]|nr:WD40 repeat domain-containing protein [Anaerolineaceae bacterium]
MGIKIIQKSLWPVIALLALVWVNRLSAQETDQIAKQITWSPDGTMIAVGFDSNECDIQNPHSENLLILDATTLEVVTPGPVKSCLELFLDWTPNSEAIAIIGSHEFRIWSVTKHEFHTIPLYFLLATSIRLSPDGALLAMTDATGTARTIELETGELSNPFPIGGFLGLAWNPHGSQLAIGQINEVKIFNVDSQDEVGTIIYEYGIIEQIHWSQSGSRLVIYRVAIERGQERDLDVVDADLMEIITTISMSDYIDPQDGLTDIALNPDGNLIAGTSPLSGIYIWDTTTGELVTHFEQESIYAIDWSPDGSRLAYVPSGNDDELVGFLDDFSEAAP